ncbi:MBL fold metallo-hydrolase [Parasalinivibrio latis]|uniref:MBL fold metallo-hydrolase n=1 Tax=Parasalinivibrio latis TaxID=2952610 RepID=UPI0030E337F3
MKTHHLYKGSRHDWYMFGRDPEKAESIIDTNQYMIVTPNHAFLLDPGGIEIFSAMLANVVKKVPINKITHLFASHQDPDIISSLGLWDISLEKAQLHAPWLWEGFIRHFGMNRISYSPIPDEGGSLTLDDLTFEFIPAHYLHSSGNFHLYDPQAKLLMSGDIGAALEPHNAPLEIEDFDAHCDKMAYFHQRWMPSNEAKNDWVKRVRELDIDVICPQHGRLISGDNIPRFLDWLENLDVGIAIGGGK